MIVTRTPVRISFLGGGTDYPAFYNRHEGSVLGTTINKYNYITVSRLTSFVDYKYRISYSSQELTKNVSDIIHPSVRECIKYLEIEEGIEINIITDLPARTGLGSSSTFTVGLLNALYTLIGIEPTKKQLASGAVHIEQNMILERVGSQDQYLAAYGGLNKIEFSKNNINVISLNINENLINDLNSNLLLFFTGKRRYAHKILDEQIEKTESRENDKILLKMNDMVDLGVDLLQNSDIESFGKLLHDSWMYKKELSSKICNDEINELYSNGIKAGAYGGKLTGAGGGGFLLFVVPEEKRPSFRKVFNNLLEVNFSFDTSGSKTIFNSLG